MTTAQAVGAVSSEADRWYAIDWQANHRNVRRLQVRYRAGNKGKQMGQGASRRAQIARRFAIDWTRIAPDGQVFHGDPARNENWAPYGADVLAVADGRVVAVQDGIPENDPTASAKAVPITLKSVGGN